MTSCDVILTQRHKLPSTSPTDFRNTMLSSLNCDFCACNDTRVLGSVDPDLGHKVLTHRGDLPISKCTSQTQIPPPKKIQHGLINVCCHTGLGSLKSQSQKFSSQIPNPPKWTQYPFLGLGVGSYFWDLYLGLEIGINCVCGLKKSLK